VSHVAQVNESCPTDKRVMSQTVRAHKLMSSVPQIHESCLRLSVGLQLVRLKCHARKVSRYYEFSHEPSHICFRRKCEIWYLRLFVGMHLVRVKCHGMTNSATNLVTDCSHEQFVFWCLNCLWACTWRGGGLGSRPKKIYGKRLRDGVEYHLMSPTPRR